MCSECLPAHRATAEVPTVSSPKFQLGLRIVLGQPKLRKLMRSRPQTHYNMHYNNIAVCDSQYAVQQARHVCLSGRGVITFDGIACSPWVVLPPLGI